jgi:alcohol dehydrogenase class IV
VITGCGCLSALGKVAADYGERVMIVCGQSFAQRSGLLDRAIRVLRAEGLQEIVFDGVVGEASLPVVEAGIALARKVNCQASVGLGGGSAIDTAKAIAGLVDLLGSVREYHRGRALDGPGLPFIAVPTTAGTGAEVTKNAVLIDPEQEIKKSIRDDGWFARVALVDPETTLSMPPEVTASTGSDALCQAIEAYTSIGASPVTDALAMRAISLLGHNLLRAYNAGDDIAAREAMSMGSLLAGMAMANARLGGVHGMAHPLGSHYHLPHGVVCGVLLPYTMEYNVRFATEKYAVVARLMGEITDHLTPEAAAQKAVARVRELLRQVDIPVHLRELGVTGTKFDLIVKESLPSGSLKHNPRPLVAEDVRRILEAALGPAKAG